MKALSAAARWCLTALALALAAYWAAAFALDASGLTRARAERELERALGAPVRVERAQTSWLAPEIALLGLSLSDPAGAVRIERAVLVFGWNGSIAPRLERVEVSGGRAVLSRPLLDALSRSRHRAAQAAAASPASEPPAIDIALERIELSVLGADGTTRSLGWLSGLASAAAGSTELAARLDLPPSSPNRRGGTVYAAGSMTGDGALELTASAASIAVEPAAPWLAALAPWLDALEPRGELSLEARATIDPADLARSRARVLAALREGRARAKATSAELEAISVDLEAELDGDLAARDAWRGVARASARWRNAPLQAWLEWTPGAAAGDDARAWLAAPRVEIGRDLAAAVGIAERIPLTLAALEPRGFAALSAGVRWPRGAALDAPVATLELALEGAAGMTYVGWPERRGESPQGFPLPVEGLTGRVVALYDARAERRWTLAFVRLLGTHSGLARDVAQAFAEGVIVAPRPGGDRPDFDIRVGAHGVPVDARLQSALAHLRGTEFIWPSFAPEGGTASFGARLVKTEAIRHPAAKVEIDLAGVRGLWAELPVAIEGIQGRVEVTVDSRIASGSGFELYGTSPTGCRVRITGRVQDDPSLAAGEGDRSLRVFDVSLGNLALRGVDRDVIVASLVGLGPALDQLAPTGRIDLSYRSASERPGGDLAWLVEVTPQQVQVTPSAFRVPARGVRGRVLVAGKTPMRETEREERVLTRLLPLVGEWPAGSRVAGVAHLPSDGDGVIRLYGADIDLTNRSLIGAFRESFTGGTLENLDLGLLDVDGRIDFTGDLTLPAATPSVPRSAYRVFLRENDVRGAAEGARFDLGDLRGILVQREGELYGERIEATLAGSEIVLERARFYEDAGAFRVDAEPRAADLPLDREHLALFLDPATVDALVERFRFGGRVDIEKAALSLARPADGSGGEVRFRGDVRVRDGHVDFGVPLEIERAGARIDDLVYEGGHVRASVRVDGLDGRLADRRIEGARLAFTYVEPHLSVIDVDGELEDGRLRRIEKSAGAFGIDLVPPYHFDLALRLDDVRVDGLLRGLFESDFASSGRLDGQLRLEGMLQRVTTIAGQGSAEMRDTTLWTIPVVRGLFSQLDLDAVATFTRARSDLAFANGAIRMGRLSVSSPLLELVGSGTLDFDGTLHHDLEVRYALVDRLGPLRRLFYWVQNSLLRVSIRGDMERPRVVLRGVLGFLQEEDRRGRDLPLPPFAPLPERF
jgi:hypothetical protein